MMDKERFMVKEVSEATGLPTVTVRSRIKTLKIEHTKGVTYEDIKRIVAYQPKRIKTDPKKIDKLKLQLKNDGYQIGK